MGYPMALDEFTDMALVNELVRRAEAQRDGKCSYCGYKAGQHIAESLRVLQKERGTLAVPDAAITRATETCRFPERHSGVITLAREATVLYRLHDLNVSRKDRWHGDQSDGWSSADWSNALAGEAGELCNKVKKLRRHETGVANMVHSTPDVADLKAGIGEELADVLIYADLNADFHDISLAWAIIQKFNEVSVEAGFPERL